MSKEPAGRLGASPSRVQTPQEESVLRLTPPPNQDVAALVEEARSLTEDDFYTHPNRTFTILNEVADALAALQASRRPGPSEESHRVGAWLSAALDDDSVCAEMKADIRAWFDAGLPLPTYTSTVGGGEEQAVCALRAKYGPNWWQHAGWLDGEFPAEDQSK